MKKRVFVWCDFNLVSILQKVYGPNTEIVTSASVGNIDLFIFTSAKSILNNGVDPKELKKLYGNPEAKTVTMSYESSYLDLVKRGDYGIDFFFPGKFELETTSKLPEETKITLRSYLYD
jgi:hypothetical protein